MDDSDESLTTTDSSNNFSTQSEPESKVKRKNSKTLKEY